VRRTPSFPLVLVDTDVLSYFFRRDTRAERYERALRDRRVVMTAMTRAELYHWAESRDWGHKKREDLRTFMDRYRTVYPDDAICQVWGEVVDGARRRGRPIGSSDAWQAATALFLEIPLITHNADDFAGVPRLVVISD
jgi:tRNA(fMet)-specific endonuclease VapC